MHRKAATAVRCRQRRPAVTSTAVPAGVRVQMGKGGVSGSALQAGHEAVLRLLLDKNMDVNAQEDGTTMHSAGIGSLSKCGRTALLEKNVDINAHGKPLQQWAAGGVAGGHEAVVRLQVSSAGGREVVMGLRLQMNADADERADANAGGEYDNALQVAGSQARGGRTAAPAEEHGRRTWRTLWQRALGGIGWRSEVSCPLLRKKHGDINAQGGATVPAHRLPCR